MTRPITVDDLFKFAAGQFPEPLAPVSGQSHYYGLIAALVNQIMTNRTEVLSLGSPVAQARYLVAQESGLLIALGVVLSDRAWSRRDDTYDDREWVGLCLSRAEGYLTWLQPLLDPKPVDSSGMKREGEAQ